MATFSLGLAADLSLLLHQGLSSSLRVGLIRHRAAARQSAVSLFGPKQEVTDWNTWDLTAVLSSYLRGLLAPGAGLNKEGSAATDLCDSLALLLVANRGCWLVLAMPGDC